MNSRRTEIIEKNYTIINNTTYLNFPIKILLIHPTSDHFPRISRIKQRYQGSS